MSDGKMRGERNNSTSFEKLQNIQIQFITSLVLTCNNTKLNAAVNNTLSNCLKSIHVQIYILYAIYYFWISLLLLQRITP